MAKGPSLTIFTTPQDAALAFYQAFESKDLDAMMLTWAEDEEVICIHPGGGRLVGYDAVRASWEQLFSSDSSLYFRLENVVMLESVGMAIQSAMEHISVGRDRVPRGTAIASNVFLRTPMGWRLIVHHSSPTPAVEAAHPTGPLH